MAEKTFEELEKEKIKENKKYLDIFENEMRKEKLSEKTIKKHLSNIDIYINGYLLFRDILNMEDGVNLTFGFFENFFPNKCIFSTENRCREMMTSLIKFYKVMLDYGYVNKTDYEIMVDEIKVGKKDWVEKCKLD